tara:strand:+ start:404 stop:685 length:282 start_codon:yes stop_codon:yes gene_type:complete
MSLVEETDVTPGSESITLSKDPIQASIVEKKVTKAKKEFRNEKGKRWQKIFDFDKSGMTEAQVIAEQGKRRKKVKKERGALGKATMKNLPVKY